MTAANASIAYRDAFFARFFFGKDSVASRFLITIDAIAAMRTRRLQAIIVIAAFVIWRVKLVAAIATIAWRDAFFYAFFSENDSVASRFFNYYRRNCGVAGVALTSNHFNCCFCNLARKVRSRDSGDSVTRRFFLRF